MEKKKDSIFTSVFPQPEPEPASTPVTPQPPAPAHPPAEEISDQLKAKFESLERNIVEQLEKKLSEHLKPEPCPAAEPAEPAVSPATAMPPEVSALISKLELLEHAMTVQLATPAPAPKQESAPLLRKIEELERRLAEFGSAASISAAQFKNIEESKISARREIEDLLKAVREQQKYSEMDRQMHEQLEKSWVRVEELEKKLMGFYASLLESGQKKDDISGRQSSELAARLSSLDSRLADQERIISGLDAALAKALDTCIARMQGMSLDGTAVSEVKQALKHEAALNSAQNEERIRLQAQAARSAVEEVIRDKVEGLRSGIMGEFINLRRESEVSFTRLEEAYKRQLGDIHSRHSAAAVQGMVALAELRADAVSIARLVSNLELHLGAFLSQVDKSRVPFLSGVSGLVMKRNIDALEGVYAGLKADLKTVVGLEQDLDRRLKDIGRENV